MMPDVLYSEWIEQKLAQKRDWRIMPGAYGRVKFLHQHWDTPVTLADVCAHNEHELLRFPNIGSKTLGELKKLLTEDGLHLGWGRR